MASSYKNIQNVLTASIPSTEDAATDLPRVNLPPLKITRMGSAVPVLRMPTFVHGSEAQEVPSTPLCASSTQTTLQQDSKVLQDIDADPAFGKTISKLAKLAGDGLQLVKVRKEKGNKIYKRDPEIQEKVSNFSDRTDRAMRKIENPSWEIKNPNFSGLFTSSVIKQTPMPPSPIDNIHPDDYFKKLLPSIREKEPQINRFTFRRRGQQAKSEAPKTEPAAQPVAAFQPNLKN